MDSVAPAENRFTHLRIEASQRLLWCYTSIWLLCIILWCTIDLLLWVWLSGLCILFGHAVWWLGSHYLRCWKHSVRNLISDGKNWSVEVDDLVERVILQPDYWVSAGMILLRLRGQESGRHYNLVLFPDSGDSEQLRRLRIELRWLIPARSGSESDSYS